MGTPMAGMTRVHLGDQLCSTRHRSNRSKQLDRCLIIFSFSSSTMAGPMQCRFAIVHASKRGSVRMRRDTTVTRHAKGSENIANNHNILVVLGGELLLVFRQDCTRGKYY
jgi:hypothetical protein